MTCLAINIVSLFVALVPAPKGFPEPVQSGPQPGKRIQGIFRPVAFQYAANAELNGQRINPLCHYGPNPTILIFARDVGPGLQKLVKRLDAEVGKLKPFRLGVCVVLLTDEPPEAAVKKLKSLLDGGKNQRVTLAYFDAAGPNGFGIADEAELTVLAYKKCMVAANQAFRKGELTDKAIDRVIADIDSIVPDVLAWSGVIMAPGETRSLKLYVRRDRVTGPVTLKLSDLPKGVSARQLTIPADESEGHLPIVAENTAPLGESLANGIVTSARSQAEIKVVIWLRQPHP